MDMTDLKLKRTVRKIFDGHISEFYHRIKPFPDLLIIGTQKGKTTSLYNHLISHPQVLGAAQKERLYFDYNFPKDVNWYRKYFPLLARVKNQLVTGEADADYLYHLHAAERIAQTTESVKLIILLRNPVDRAISHYWLEVKRGHEKLSIHKAFEKERERIEQVKKVISTQEGFYSFEYEHYSYVDRGKYAEQIKRYLAYFDRCQMLILKSEDLSCHPQVTFDRVTKFLNLEKHTLQNTKPYNVREYPQKGYSDLKGTLSDFYRPYNRELYEMLNVTPWW